jgi:hypothetical protein
MTRCVFAIVLIVVFGTPCVGQVTPNGSIRGHVRDEQNAAIPGVTVVATSADMLGPRSAITDDEGFYRLLDLPPGSYTISAQVTGFARAIHEGIVVRAGLNVGLDLVMKLGAVTESVVVKSDRPLIETQTSAQAFNLDGDLQRTLPLSTSNHWSNFLAVTPGITGSRPPAEPPIPIRCGAATLDGT